MSKYPCPCCGYVVFDEPPGSYDICPFCYWEDDIAQLRFARLAGGANRVSLIDAQRNYAALGASESRFAGNVRSPGQFDRRDPGWRPLDAIVDQIEGGETGVDYGDTYPEDATSLYYWRPTFWR